MPNRDFAQDAETIISASVKVEGDFVSEGNVLIEGSVEGSLRTQKDLRVGEQAKIAANVTAANAVIAGEVKGNVTVSERLELEATARILGDVVTKNLVVASGAVLNGKVTMNEVVSGERISAPAARKARVAPQPVVEEVIEEEPVMAAEPEPAHEEEPEKEMARATAAPAPEEKKKTFNPFFTS
jgi:cytoskeletal protein CcmA (bactofilin family)